MPIHNITHNMCIVYIFTGMYSAISNDASPTYPWPVCTVVIAYVTWVTQVNKQVSQMRAHLAACCEAAGYQSSPPKVSYDFEHVAYCKPCAMLICTGAVSK